MIFNAGSFSALLQALCLTQVSYKRNSESVSALAADKSPGYPSWPHDADPKSLPDSLSFPSKEPAHTARDQHSECFVEPYFAPPLGNQVFPPFDTDMANLYRYRQQQSVNFGSWFVHENWMSPSLFTCAAGEKFSELDIASGWGSLDSARSLLERHWDTWITKSDFQYLASIGINTVRLPIGYWSLGPYYCKDTPFAPFADVYQNCWPRIVRAINMAAEAGIGVLVDLHGAVGSQNGQPHSGISDGAANMFENPKYMDKTIDVLMFLMEHLAPVTNVVGIQLLNEPNNVPELTDFYSRAIETMRQSSAPSAASFPLYVHNGFDIGRFTGYIANRTDFVVQDHHSYFVFTPDDENKPASGLTNDVRGPVADMLASASGSQRRNLVVDEWSCALTPQSLSSEPDKHRAQSDFCKAQLDVYANTTAGWSFWSYFKEGCEDDPGWCFKAAVNNTLPATFFSYGQAPGTDPDHVQVFVANMTVPSPRDILSIIQGNGTAPEPRSTFTRRSFQRQFGLRRDRHRFEAIHHLRQQKQNPLGGLQLTDAQRSTLKGYADGFLAAKTFASFRLSKLGFVGQYVYERMAQLGPAAIPPGTEQDYRDGFGRGLMDGQEVVQGALNRGQ
ncbi:putative cellulase (glycosyl hydrolase family 5) [Lyophyllum shimeji]|uniref:Cellulase (Glycosyl hydrolase family 5) n=1 Tax=Lyophyllum shimeji TaxID=47721 RepID=A0A9P3PHA4_LYOSH|nr:putative cellulase (glycosyl hydrolase family 5) [Lyophyllum shimeji]